MEDNNPEVIFRGKNTPIVIGRRQRSDRSQSHTSGLNKSGGVLCMCVCVCVRACVYACVCVS